MPATTIALLALAAGPATGSQAWGISAGGAGGAGITYRLLAADGSGWSFAGSLLRFSSTSDTGWPYVLAGVKRFWVIRETDRARLYQSAGTSLLWNGYPSFYRPQPTLAGGGSQGIHTFGTGYGIQLGPTRGWRVGLEVDLGLAVIWPGSFASGTGATGLNAYFMPMPELSLMYEY
jgi:hypothetical protein